MKTNYQTNDSTKFSNLRNGICLFINRFFTIFSRSLHTLSLATNPLAKLVDINEAGFHTVDAVIPQRNNSFVRGNGNGVTVSEEKRKLHIMMLGLRGFPNVQGGVETHAEHLCPLLVQLGCNVEVIVRSPYQSVAIGKEWNGVKFSRIWSPKSKGLEALLHSFLGVLYAGIKRPDILHIHAIGPALLTPLARLLGLRVVVTHHGPDYDRQKWGWFAKSVLLLGEFFGMHFANGRIVISNVIRNLVMRKHVVYSHLIYNGVGLPDIAALEADPQVRNLALDMFGLKRVRYILIVSRFVPEKRHLDLIKAFKEAALEDYKLVIVGGSLQADEYEESVISAAKATPNVVLTGYQTGAMLRSLYLNAGMFVLPSSHEGLSISLLEALSYGLPVIASNIPANLELGLQDHRYFELGNIEQLTYKLQQNAEIVHTESTSHMIREWVKCRYNWNDIAKQTVKLYYSTKR